MSDIIKEIPCSFKSIPNYPEAGLKQARYSGSFHWDIKDFGSKRWVVLGYLDVDWETIEKEQQISKDEILLGCLKHLNVVPEKKKHAKKEPKPKYGILEPYKADFKTKDGKSFIVVQFKTNERTNPHFWCEGHSWDGIKTGKKRGRKPKVAIEQIEE